MTSAANWRVVEAVARLLEEREREAVLGDLEETGASPGRALADLGGLLVRRQWEAWRNWRPWLAAFGLALPGSLVLMGLSISVSRTYLEWLEGPVREATGFDFGEGFWLLLANLLLLVGWSWTSGFVVGTLSRRTVWVSALLSFLPCLFCLSRFRMESLSRVCLLLFLAPAMWGVRRGLRLVRIDRRTAIVLAIAVTAVTIPVWSRSGMWMCDWALSWPAWYLVATARAPGDREERERHGR